MTASTAIDRGNYLEFTSQFFDAKGVPAIPDYANVYVSYLLNGAKQLDTVPMEATSDPTIWFARWSSAGINPNTIQWSVSGAAGGLFMVEDGAVDVSANNANQVGVHP